MAGKTREYGIRQSEMGTVNCTEYYGKVKLDVFRDTTISFNIGDFKRAFKAAVGWKLGWTEVKTKKGNNKEKQLHKRENKCCGTWKGI